MVLGQCGGTLINRDMTVKEQSVVNYMKERPEQVYFGLELMPLIFSKETIEKYNHSRLNSLVIEKMTWLYLGKMARKGILKWNINGYYLTKIQ